MTLPQECGDVIGGVVVPKIREEELKKKTEKVFFSGVPNEVRDGRAVEGQRPGASRPLSGVPPFQAMSGPTWLPPKQPEPARAPQGRAIPRGTPGPPPAHGAGKAALVRQKSYPAVALTSVLQLQPPALPASSYPFPKPGGTAACALLGP